MAWRAWVSQPVGITPDGWFSVAVDYYDDADPANAGVGMIGPGNGTAAASTNLITITGHGLVAGDQVVFTALTGGAPLMLGVNFTVLAAGLTANVFAVSKSPASSTAVDITTNATALTAFKLKPPLATVWSKAWDLPPETTTDGLSAKVVLEGQTARGYVTARDGARAVVPVGTNIAIP
jgi:hypothetical protein